MHQPYVMVVLGLVTRIRVRVHYGQDSSFRDKDQFHQCIHKAGANEVQTTHATSSVNGGIPRI